MLRTFICVVALSLSSNLFAAQDPLSDIPLLHQATVSGDIERVRDLVEGAAGINKLDPKMGNSPLHLAALTDHHLIVRYLIEHGVFVNLQSPRSGFTPLMIAAWYSKAQKIKELFQAKDLNINIQTPAGLKAKDWIGGFDNDLNESERILMSELKSPFEDFEAKQSQTLEQQSLIQTLLDKNLSESQKTKKVEELLTAGADVNSVQPNIGNGNDSHTALLIAARSGFTEIVRLLLEAGAVQTRRGLPMDAIAMHKAAYKGHADVLERLLAAPEALEMMNDQCPNNGYTPPHDAIWHGNTEAARVLILAGARQDLLTYEGDTPKDLARRYGYTDIIELLDESAREEGTL